MTVRSLAFAVALALALAVSACTASSTADTHRDGRVTGEITMVGGPAPGSPRPVTATAAFYSHETNGEVTGKAIVEADAANGRFTATVPPGTFYVVAHYRGGPPATPPKRVRVAAGRTTKLSLEIDVP